MKNKYFIIALCVMLLLPLIGCASFLEDESLSISKHVSSSQGDQTDNRSKEVSDYDALESAILQFVTDHVEKGNIRFSVYDGNVENDISKACTEVSYNTALGAYAVYYMSYNINRIVSYHEVEFVITYKRSAAEIKSIIKTQKISTIEAELDKLVISEEKCLAIQTSEASVDDEFVSEYIKNLYYNDPEQYVLLPEITVETYPESGIERIINVNLSYAYETSKMDTMKDKLSSTADDIIGQLDDGNDGEQLLQICQILADSVVYVNNTAENEEYDRWDAEYTAYGALVNEKAAGEGFAMAYKLLCNKLDIECYVVIGRYNGIEHAWNIVKLNGEYYHVDVSKGEEKGISEVFLRSDEDVLNEYWWDTELYEKCDGSLTYYDIINGTQTIAPPVDLSPEETDTGVTEVTPSP